LAARRFWFILHRAAKAPCRRRPVSSTLGTAMPGFGGSSLLQIRTPRIADTGGTRLPSLALAGTSSANPKVKSAALRGILQMSPGRLMGAPTHLSGHLRRHLGSPLGSQSHGRAAHEHTCALRPGRAGGAGQQSPSSSTRIAQTISGPRVPLPLNNQAVCHIRTAVPNRSFNRSANGRPPGPSWRYAVHFRQPGPGVLPLSPG
jgi:hypothetical protein